MKTRAQFEVESVSAIGSRGYLVIAKRCDDVDFWLNSSTKLNGCAISHADIPRTLDENGQQRRDIWGFFLENQEDYTGFEPGNLVYLESEFIDVR